MWKIKLYLHLEQLKRLLQIENALCYNSLCLNFIIIILVK